MADIQEQRFHPKHDSKQRMNSPPHNPPNESTTTTTSSYTLKTPQPHPHSHQSSSSFGTRTSSGKPHHDDQRGEKREAAAVVTASTPIHKSRKMMTAGSVEKGHVHHNDYRNNFTSRHGNHHPQIVHRDDYSRNSSSSQSNSNTPLARRIFASPSDSIHPRLSFDPSNVSSNAARHSRRNSNSFLRDKYLNSLSMDMDSEYHPNPPPQSSSRPFLVPTSNTKHPLRHKTLYPSPKTEAFYEKDRYHSNRDIIFRSYNDREREHSMSRSEEHDRPYYTTRHRPSSPEYSRYPREHHPNNAPPLSHHGPTSSISKHDIQERDIQGQTEMSETQQSSSKETQSTNKTLNDKNDIQQENTVSPSKKETIQEHKEKTENQSRDTTHRSPNRPPSLKSSSSSPKRKEPLIQKRMEDVSPIMRQYPQDGGRASTTKSRDRDHYNDRRPVPQRLLSVDGEEAEHFRRRPIMEYHPHPENVASRYYNKHEYRHHIPRYHNIEETEDYHYTSRTPSPPSHHKSYLSNQHPPPGRYPEHAYRSDPMEDKENLGDYRKSPPNPSPYVMARTPYSKYPRSSDYKPDSSSSFGYLCPPPPQSYSAQAPAHAHRNDHYERGGIAASPIERDLEHYERQYSSSPYYEYPNGRRHEKTYPPPSYQTRHSEEYKSHIAHHHPYEDDHRLYHHPSSRMIHPPPPPHYYEDDHDRRYWEENVSLHQNFPRPRKLYTEDMQESRLHRHPKEVLDSQKRSSYGITSPKIQSASDTAFPSTNSSSESKKRKSETKPPTPHVSQRKRKKMYSDYVGVTYNKTHAKFQACITHYRKQHYLGRYKLAVDAAKAYDESARLLKGQGWKINFRTEEDYTSAKKKEEEKLELQKQAAKQKKEEDQKLKDAKIKEMENPSSAELKCDNATKEQQEQNVESPTSSSKQLKDTNVSSEEKDTSKGQESTLSSKSPSRNVETSESNSIPENSLTSPVRTVSNDELSSSNDDSRSSISTSSSNSQNVIPEEKNSAKNNLDSSKEKQTSKSNKLTKEQNDKSSKVVDDTPITSTSKSSNKEEKKGHNLKGTKSDLSLPEETSGDDKAAPKDHENSQAPAPANASNL